MTSHCHQVRALRGAGYTLKDIKERGIDTCVSELLVDSNANVSPKATERLYKAPQLYDGCIDT